MPTGRPSIAVILGTRAGAARPVGWPRFIDWRRARALGAGGTPSSRLEAYLREAGFFGGGAAGVVADLYLGYGLGRAPGAPRGPTRPSPAGCRWPPAACVPRRSPPATAGPLSSRRVGADLGRGRSTRAAVEVGQGRDRARRRLPGQPRPAPLGSVPRRPERPRARARATAAACTASRSCGDGWTIVSASPELFLARRGDRVCTMPIKGTRPAGSSDDLRALGEGRRRAPHDRRPRAQRSRTRLRAGHASAGPSSWPSTGWPASRHLVSTVEGRLRPRRRPRRAARGALPGRLGHRLPQDLGHRPHRRARAGRPRRRRWARSGPSTRTATSSSPSRSARSPSPTAASISGSAAGSCGTPIRDDEIEESWVKARPLLAAIGAPRRRRCAA